MSFVGIICTPKQEGYVKQILHVKLSMENVIVLKEDNIDNFKNITFETIAIFSSQSSAFKKKEAIIKILEKAKYFIINADEEITLECVKNIRAKIISYGFNTKSTVTASSVKEDNILVCLQRTILNRLDKKIEPQEILIPLEEHKVNTSTMMGIISILLVYGIEKI